MANSITREALPAGMFNGKAKQLYDCLYSLTRGAVVPLMSVRISRAELMKKSDIGSKVTLEQNLRRLIAAGFVSMKMIGGIQGGNEYTVYLPEEVTRPSIPPSTGPSPPTPPSPSYPPQKLGGVPPPETRGARRGVNVENTDRSGNAKTSFKTNTEIDDDEAFAQLLAHLRQAAAEVTGREASASEAERWGELGELLATELKIAAGRTGSVSSVPAFLTEHLRRRLWKKEKAQLEREAVDSSPAAHQSQPTSDASKCPDCFGTGMWYPEGYEKGVARCRHERLR